MSPLPLLSCARPRVAAFAASLLLLAPAAGPLHAQAAAPPARAWASAAQPAGLSDAELTALAETHVALAAVMDSSGAQLAKVRNKTAEAQQSVREATRAQISALLSKRGLTLEEFERRRFVVSTNAASRAQFDQLVAKLQGAPLPGAVPVRAAPSAPEAPITTAAPSAVAITLPDGPAGVHVGHVAVSFGDTPDKAGLLPTALAEARTALQHAGFAARTPDNLQAMQLHTGHVLHALNPTLEAKGPGKGYGATRAIAGVVSHIELAAKADGASTGVKAHAGHIATAARSAALRAEQMVGLATQVRQAASAAVAAPLVAQIASLAEQLTAGYDANADGRVGYGDGEGGLQQADEHLKLLLGSVGK